LEARSASVFRWRGERHEGAGLNPCTGAYQNRFSLFPILPEGRGRCCLQNFMGIFEPELVDSVQNSSHKLFFSQAVTCDRSSAIPSMGTRHHQFQYRK